MAEFLTTIVALQFEEFSPPHYVVWSLFWALGMKCLQSEFTWDSSRWLGGRPFSFEEVPHQKGPKPLLDEQLTWKDCLYINVNTFVVTPIYFTHVLKHVRDSDRLEWSGLPSPMILVQYVLLLVIYDAIYVPGHRFMHIPLVYPWIHKHHHRQFVPFRGTYDGINVTPLEYLFGTYLHLFSFQVLQFIVSAVGPFLGLAPKVHIVMVPLFWLSSMWAASLNHTRYNVRIPGIFEVSDHSVHHAFPTSNYGQFTMWWDKIYGSYKSHEELVGKKSSKRVSCSR